MIKIKIKGPNKNLWEGEARAISSENSDGTFDILEKHANFITLIQKKPIVIHLKNKKRKEFVFERAVMMVKNNNVSIYTHLIHRR